MEVIFILIGISLLLALVFLGLFFRAMNKGQYDDNYTPSVRMLFENKTKQSIKNTQTIKSKKNVRSNTGKV
ncbi:cbb3-type cytochrome oxidase assembly protein CcoS [Pararhodonellum marinum]|uniref:cbb3-type cytochrome oxidase assembly protein CcoS n=1 Tax=Pararhodonellum marinum TaxID=2755358 RepID=UPI00188F674C|nr:cbb3-type cytochrome oxidase assembly protein CcoS [Pararhodonellum marinum]